MTDISEVIQDLTIVINIVYSLISNNITNISQIQVINISLDSTH